MEQITTEIAIDKNTIANKPIEENLLSIINKNFIAKNYVMKLFLLILGWFIIILSFIWIIDPYGVSPVHIRLSHVNTLKPERIDIDRLIKPYEVWRDQPKTVFLGTSRIHQSINPYTLDNTKFAPAYNAAVPASTLSQNAANLEEYFRLDKNLQYVFIELFIYNFIFPQPEAPNKTFNDFLRTSASLTSSADALISAFKTLSFNKSALPVGPYISPRGNWIRPEAFSTKDTFNQKLYIDTIVSIHKNIPDMIIQPTAIESLDRIVEICKKHHAKLYMIITPSYPWDDYRLLSLGYWPLLEEWVKKMSAYDNVFSASQYNPLLEEQAGEKMKWWNDPIHFSDNMGHLMLLSFLGAPNPEIPSNLLRAVKPSNLMTVLQERRNGLNQWILKNQQFVTAFNVAKVTAGHVERKVIKKVNSCYRYGN